MALLKPNSEDIRKINAEINQIINQRFLIVTLAITISGVILSWAIPRQIPSGQDALGGFSFAIASLHIIILILLFYFHHRIKQYLRVLTSYLVETGASEWEKAWREYRKMPHSAYTDIHTIIFMLLTILATLFPFVVALTFGLCVKPVAAAIFTVALSIICLTIMYCIGFREWLDSEQKAIERWKELNK